MEKAKKDEALNIGNWTKKTALEGKSWSG